MRGRERLDPIECEGGLHVQRLLGQSVPSLSKTAIRSAGGTKSAPPACVTRRTKSSSARFGAPSFHDASGSAGSAEVDTVAGAAERCSVAGPQADIAAARRIGR